ncbi:hypothetical protein PR048_011097 [Dryococelus australis]|uniref:Uncharacterized protein n=1 Tax=Dryococelus australis TaxID=614101 RepID=A0ABQ9HLB4_9NEOP|nr:hypothetical protein PR048_011097 [Dryococelus australis]
MVGASADQDDKASADQDDKASADQDKASADQVFQFLCSDFEYGSELHQEDKRGKRYSQEILAKAVLEVQSGLITAYMASTTINIPPNMLIGCVKGRRGSKSISHGRTTAFPLVMEKKLQPFHHQGATRIWTVKEGHPVIGGGVHFLLAVAGNGKKLPPVVIFKGKHLLVNWQSSKAEAFLSTSYVAIKNGWRLSYMFWIKPTEFSVYNKDSSAAFQKILLLQGCKDISLHASEPQKIAVRAPVFINANFRR